MSLRIREKQGGDNQEIIENGVTELKKVTIPPIIPLNVYELRKMKPNKRDWFVNDAVEKHVNEVLKVLAEGYNRGSEVFSVDVSVYALNVRMIMMCYFEIADCTDVEKTEILMKKLNNYHKQAGSFRWEHGISPRAQTMVLPDPNLERANTTSAPYQISQGAI